MSIFLSAELRVTHFIHEEMSYFCGMCLVQLRSFINIPLQYSEIKWQLVLFFEHLSKARNGKLDEFVYIMC